VTKALAKSLLYKDNIKPPYINANQWNVKNCKLPISVIYLAIISVIYQKEKGKLHE
jgi:hypothetical protein